MPPQFRPCGGESLFPARAPCDATGHAVCPAALLPGEPRDYPQNTDVISSAGSQPAAFLPGFVAAHTRGSVRGSVRVSGPRLRGGVSRALRGCLAPTAGFLSPPRPVHACPRPSTLLNSEMRVWGLRTPQQARGLPERLAGLSGYSDGRLNPAWGPRGLRGQRPQGCRHPGTQESSGRSPLTWTAGCCL